MKGRLQSVRRCAFVRTMSRCSFVPFYLAVVWIVGVVLYLYYAFCRTTSHISIEALGSRDLTQHSIFCMLENPKTVLGRSPLLSSGSSRSKSRCYQRCGRTCRM